ncbi:MAG TPA: class D sortase [Candidatus Polarisedimenticolia bacterium]|nr:class D sortase [Candidatus Polarisedimenticolia bacterium]
MRLSLLEVKHWWSRGLAAARSRLPRLEHVALALAAGAFVVYGGLRVHVRAMQAEDRRAFEQELERRSFPADAEAEPWLEPLEGLPEDPGDFEDGGAGADPVARTEILFSEPEFDAFDQSEWSDRRRRAYREALGDDVNLPLGRLEIPSIGLDVMVLQGTDDWTLNRAVGHIEGTAHPDEPGNVGIAGHRDGFFRGLRHLTLGQRIHMTTLEGNYQYVVRSIDVVRPSQVEVLDPTPRPALTLVTCYPFYHVGTAPQRYIVRAERVESAAR